MRRFHLPDSISATGFFLFVFLMSPFLYAQEKANTEGRNTAYLAGKIYDYDQRTALENVTVRIVGVATGQVLEEKTDEEGCYRFDDVQEGAYSFSVVFKQSDYNSAKLKEFRRILPKQKDSDGENSFLLAEKIKVGKLDSREVIVSVCAALSQGQSLKLLEECHVCLKGLPRLAINIAAVSSLVPLVSLGDDPPEASTFRPKTKIP